MRSGKLNKRVELWFRDTTKNAFGEHSESFDVTAIRWASIEPLSSKEFLSAIGQESRISVKIRLRYDNVTSTLKSDDQIKHDGVLYNIDADPINTYQKNRELVFMCSIHDRKS